MKPRLSLGAAIAALVLPAAYAQNPAPAPQAQAPQPAPEAQVAPTQAVEANAPAAAPAPQVNANTPVPQPPANLVEEPNASAFVTDNAPEAERVKPIVDALNADTSLKASKIVVVPDQDVITLIGVTVSDAQRKRATEIASTQAGEAKVVNALTTQQLVITTPPAAS